MTVKNLSQLKRVLASGAPFEIVSHHIHPEYTGHVRSVRIMQTNGMYTGMYGDPHAYINGLNSGKGLWCSFGKASDWTFCGDIIKLNLHGRPVMDIRLIGKDGE